MRRGNFTNVIVERVLMLSGKLYQETAVLIEQSGVAVWQFAERSNLVEHLQELLLKLHVVTHTHGDYHSSESKRLVFANGILAVERIAAGIAVRQVLLCVKPDCRGAFARCRHSVCRQNLPFALQTRLAHLAVAFLKQRHDIALGVGELQLRLAVEFISFCLVEHIHHYAFRRHVGTHHASGAELAEINRSGFLVLVESADKIVAAGAAINCAVGGIDADKRCGFRIEGIAVGRRDHPFFF